MAGFNLENYADVATRIEEFVLEFPKGNIQSHIFLLDGPVVVIEARVFRTPEDAVAGVYTSGFAREVEGKSNVNKTSHVENCETSAIGRALANMGYGTAKNRVSRSEMLKVGRMSEDLEAMTNYIMAAGVKVPDDLQVEFNGEQVLLKSYIRENWEAIQEQFVLALSVVSLLETTTGVKFAK